MVIYSCEKCGKTFKQKGHYTKHLQRKTPCDNIKDKIEKIVENKVEEVIKEKIDEMVEKGDIEIKNKENDDNVENIEMENENPKENKDENLNSQDLNNMYFVGENLDLLKKIKSDTIDMIYMDPPYNTGRDFGDFNDKYKDYNAFMKDRVKECHRILKKNGNIIIHIEAKISHHIRYICDEIFGDKNFKNEIIWKTGGNVKNKYQLGRSHDNIIVYGKSKKCKFFPMYKPYDEEGIKKLPLCPHHNMRYGNSAAHSSQPDVNPRPNLRYTWNGNYKQWLICEEKMKILHGEHRLVYNKNGIPRIKR